MSETLTITLPWPDPALSPNSRDRWGKIKAVSIARNYAYLLACEQPEYIGAGVPLMVVMQFNPPDNKHRDLDNMIAMMKSAVDGICLAKGCNDHQIQEIRAVRLAVVQGGRVTIGVREVTD